MKRITKLPTKPDRQPEKYKKVMGIDSSSLGIAWTVVVDAVPTDSGKIKLDKIKNIQDKLKEIVTEFTKLLDIQRPDHISIEMPIFVKNPATARTLAFVVGTLISVAESNGYETSLVEIASWKSFIGYFNLSSKFQASAKQAMGVTEGKKLCDRLRKEQTQRIISLKYKDFNIEDNDISDSCAIALWAWNRYCEELYFEKNKDIAFNLAELESWGLEI